MERQRELPFSFQYRAALPHLLFCQSRLVNASAGYAQNTALDSLLYRHFHETNQVGQVGIIAELHGKYAKYLDQ